MALAHVKRVSAPVPGPRPPGSRREATIYDVAREAAVSPATVSRVMNGTARVSPAMRERVEQAAARIDFQPYDLAAGRARRATGMVGLIIPDITNPFWAEVALGAEEALRPHGFGLMLGNTGDSLAREEEMIALLRRKRVDGVLVSAMRDASAALQRLRAVGTSVVLLGHGADDGTFDLVTADGERGAYLAASHLRQLGHRQLGFLGGPPDERTTRARRAGFLRALSEFGLTAPPACIAEGPGWGYDAGAERLGELLARGTGVTGIVAANDVIALGALAALHRAGRRVPEDVSLTGFDDLPLAAISHPALTTVWQPRRERGRIAAELLVERMAVARSAPVGPGASPPVGREAERGAQPRRIILEPRLVVRQSTAPPRST
jgi:DNA-binding LacI/PurR family transcriptional regulator